MIFTRFTAFLTILLLCSLPAFLISCVSQDLKQPTTPIAPPTPTQKNQADVLYQEGKQLFGKHRWRLAMEKYKQALWLYQEIGNKAAMSDILIQLGLVENFLDPLSLSNKYQSPYAKQAVKTRKEILEKLELKDVGDGREFFQEALKVRRDIGDHAGEAVALIKLGETYEGSKKVPSSGGYPISYRMDDESAEPEKAVELYKEAISIYKELGDKDNQRDTLIKLGNSIAEKQGDDAVKAKEAFEQALAIYPANSQGKVEILVKLAEPDERDFWYRSCSTSQRMKYCQQALEIYRALGDKTGEQDVLSKIVLASPKLSGLQNLDRTSPKVDVILQSSLDQAKALYQIKADKDATRKVLLELAWNYYSSGNTAQEEAKSYSQASKLLNRAVAIDQESGDQKGVADTLLKIVQFHMDAFVSYQQHPTEPFLEKALAIYRELEDKKGEAWTLYQMGVIAGSCDVVFRPGYGFGACKPEQALSLLQKPLELYRQLGDRLGEAQVLSEMALSYEMMGVNRQNLHGDQPAYSDPAKANQALKLYQQALDIHTFTNDKTGKQQTLFNIAVIHQNLNRIDQAKEFYHQALSVADRDEELEGNIVCTVVSSAAFGSGIKLNDFLDLNGYLSVGDQYLQAQRGLCPSGPGGRASVLRDRRGR